MTKLSTRIADALEHLAEELAELSVATFHNDDRPGHAAANGQPDYARATETGRTDR